MLFKVPTYLLFVGASNVPSVVLTNWEAVADCNTDNTVCETTDQLADAFLILRAISFEYLLIITAKAACSSTTDVATPEILFWSYVATGKPAIACNLPKISWSISNTISWAKAEVNSCSILAPYWDWASCIASNVNLAFNLREPALTSSFTNSMLISLPPVPSNTAVSAAPGLTISSLPEYQAPTKNGDNASWPAMIPEPSTGEFVAYLILIVVIVPEGPDNGWTPTNSWAITVGIIRLIKGIITLLIIATLAATVEPCVACSAKNCLRTFSKTDSVIRLRDAPLISETIPFFNLFQAVGLSNNNTPLSIFVVIIFFS